MGGGGVRILGDSDLEHVDTHFVVYGVCTCVNMVA